MSSLPIWAEILCVFAGCFVGNMLWFIGKTIVLHIKKKKEPKEE